ncbi:kinase-like domain-containing protein [Chaetomidium leptoderma]|uniref:Kinase-like domain-containing protein n=1 Tax=Chaetomidium leptoderma TaxID=669021 RepID=A0AAN6ZUT1_9PEZI|nr:kinase-like domain-containing protein [Chaetomidium leptoderma]
MDNLDLFKPSNLLHTQEKMSLYRQGGFHPVRLGDTFKDGRYKIHHKLGWGGFSTVWLARDQSRKRWVSLKVTTADSTKSARELLMHQELHKALPKPHHLVQLLDSFVQQGPNGKHQCLVFELLGPAVDTIVTDYYSGDPEPLEATTILRITRQLLQTLAALHRAGYAHGDISGANVAFTARGLSRLSVESMFEVIGAPKSENLVRCDGKALAPGMPKQLVKTTGWDNWIDEDEEDIRLIDLGEAFPHGATPARLAEPSELKVPEKIFTEKFDYRIDLWRAGCMIYTLVIGKRPFQWLWDVDYLVAQMIHFVEDLPDEWRPRWAEIKKEAGRKHEDIPDRMTGRSKLEERFGRHVKEESLKPLLPIIRGLMRFRPQDRISAKEALRLLDHPSQHS